MAVEAEAGLRLIPRVLSGGAPCAVVAEAELADIMTQLQTWLMQPLEGPRIPMWEVVAEPPVRVGHLLPLERKEPTEIRDAQELVGEAEEPRLPLEWPGSQEALEAPTAVVVVEEELE